MQTQIEKVTSTVKAWAIGWSNWMYNLTLIVRVMKKRTLFIIYWLSHPSILGATLCFCTGLYTAPIRRRFLFTRWLLNDFLEFFYFWYDCWPWSIDYLNRFWLISVLTLTLNFQGKIWNLLYLSQNWSDCHQTKSKHIDSTLGLKCDHRDWPWPWPWPWIFKVICDLDHLVTKVRC